jgi:hypothetical protein
VKDLKGKTAAEYAQAPPEWVPTEVGVFVCSCCCCCGNMPPLGRCCGRSAKHRGLAEVMNELVLVPVLDWRVVLWVRGLSTPSTGSLVFEMDATMATLVVHPRDASTDFLEPIYAELDATASMFSSTAQRTSEEALGGQGQHLARGVDAAGMVVALVLSVLSLCTGGDSSACASHGGMECG